MRSVGKGADFSIMTAIKMTKPNAKSLYDLGVRAQSQNEVTQALLATGSSREIETAVFDPASQFLSNISRRA